MRLLSTAMLVILSAAPALADAIDGDWCREAASFHIEGPAIRTPGGSDITGDYDRHAFHYVVPKGEKGAGGDVYMQLIDEDTLQLLPPLDGAEPKPEVWKRCQPVS